MIQLGAGIHGGMVITPDFRRSGSNAVQVTYFTRDGQASGHTQFKSLADALDENFLDVDHPVSRLKKNTDPAKVFSAYEEAIFEPHNDEILNTPFHYLSPLRPLSGVAVEGFVSSDLSGRMGVLSRYEPLDLDTQTRLNLFPMSPEAIRAASEEMAVSLAPKLKSRYARKLAENMSIPQSWPYATSGANPSTEIHSSMSRGMKGFLLDDLSVVAWETNQFGQPHHADMNFRDIAPGRIDLANLIVDQNGNALIVLDHEAHEKIAEVVRAALSKMTLGSLESRVFIDTEWGTHLTIPARDARKKFGVRIDTASNPSYPNPVHALREILEQIQEGKQPGLYDFGQVLRWLDIALTGRTMKNMHDYARSAELMIEETRGEFYLSDGGYSRVWMDLDEGRAWVTDNSTAEVKRRWKALAEDEE